MREATAEDLKSAANRWLADGVYIAEVLPFPDYKTAAADADRSHAPALGAPPELKLPKLQRATLSNGLKVILAERHEVPLVNFWMAADAGYAADQFATPGTAKLTGTLLIDGTRTRSALEISDQTALLGAQLQGSSNLDFSFVRLSALKSKLDPSLDLFADVILNPSFPEADFKREQKLQVDTIEQEQSEPFSMALRVFPGLLYGRGHAYGNPLTGSGTAASVQKITRDDLVKFHEVWFRPNNATLVVAGDTTLAEMTPKLEKLFAGWKPGEVPVKNISAVQLAPKPIVYIVDKPGAGQSVILAGHVVCAAEHAAGDCHPGHERRPWRHLQLAAQYEPARGQALGLRGGQLSGGCARAAAIHRFCASADGQDQGVAGGSQQGTTGASWRIVR